MDHPHNSIKLIVEERQRELRTQSFFITQLKAIESSQAQSRRVSLFGFLPNGNLSFLVDWLFPGSNASVQTNCELQECQVNLECQSC